MEYSFHNPYYALSLHLLLSLPFPLSLYNITPLYEAPGNLPRVLSDLTPTHHRLLRPLTIHLLHPSPGCSPHRHHSHPQQVLHSKRGWITNVLTSHRHQAQESVPAITTQEVSLDRVSSHQHLLPCIQGRVFLNRETLDVR